MFDSENHHAPGWKRMDVYQKLQLLAEIPSKIELGENIPQCYINYVWKITYDSCFSDDKPDMLGNVSILELLHEFAKNTLRHELVVRVDVSYRSY